MEATFKLDPFQEEAINVLKKGISVVVSAPTGSGKTAIAEFVIEEALKGKERVFYTTPLKALSNQKFHDFQKQYGTGYDPINISFRFPENFKVTNPSPEMTIDKNRVSYKTNLSTDRSMVINLIQK